MTDTIGARIKRYEAAYQSVVTPRMPLFVRVDGRAFHRFLAQADKPFDFAFIYAMRMAAADVARQMQGFRLAYTQSDECTFMLVDYDNLTSQPWFGGEVNKIVSISAALFTAAFNMHYDTDDAVFDARCFVVPHGDAPNVFLWRQRDWERNSLQMLARAHFSHRELFGKNRSDLHEMLHTKGVNWASLDAPLRCGTFITRDDGYLCDRMDYESITALLEPPSN